MSASVLVVGVALIAGCSGSGHAAHASAGSNSAAPSSAGTYGALPTYLPSASGGADSMLTGSAGRPAVTSQGDRVLARVPGHGTVQMQVTGPVVPGEGLPKVASATTCTWTVTVDHASAPVPVRAADFLAVDEDGHPYRLQYVAHTPTPPALLRPGQHTTFELRVVMPTGEGVMRWQPAGRLLALWDFVVEND